MLQYLREEDVRDQQGDEGDAAHDDAVVGGGGVALQTPETLHTG